MNGNVENLLIMAPLIINALFVIGVIVVAAFLVKKWIRTEVARAIDQRMKSERNE